MKLYQIDKYRDYSKMKKEYYEGLLMLDDLIRKATIVATLMGVFIPALAFLANPYVVVGTIAWALAGQPFMVRQAKGWAARMGAAIQAQNNVASMSNDFFSLTKEEAPPSFGQLDLARSEFETVKFQYRSVLKNFNEGAKWNTNSFTNLFMMAWNKAAK